MVGESSTKIDIGNQFSRFPAGRTPDDGKYNGQTFREKFLRDNFKKFSVIEVLLDNALSYGSSFLEEAFGGLVRVYGHDARSLRGRLILISDDPFLVDEIWAYIDDAEALPQ